EELLQHLQDLGVHIVYVTLHVGLGTFLPVKVEDTNKHQMHAEYAIVSSETTRTINEAKQQGRRIIAVGTTSVRTLESFSQNGHVQPGEKWTNIFITPGYQFQCVDGMITNFHLPKSTLFMLVCSFAGTEFMKRAYAEAIENQYRFYSFGDGMLIV
ncbi:MAG TPA: S-adenosylmethionine:tRNA ribosyltransferase-isomerase, partial [Patescibacteria group bacterium]|nr:S-adenosylmethionine:tRNA ribosyltransferase-isomerase [Patescibacteria group bacterium]